MFYISDNKRYITDGHVTIQIAKGFAVPTKDEMKLAAKIVSALNNTYGIGVKPESVPSMKAAINTTIKRFEMYWDDMLSNSRMHTKNFKEAFLRPLKELI